MNKATHFAILALLAGIAFPRTSPAEVEGGDWVGQLKGPFDSEYTARYDHVTLKADGVKLSGTWGAYKLTGAVNGARVDIALADANGELAGALTGVSAEFFPGLALCRRHGASGPSASVT